MKALSIIVVVLALVVGIVPAFTDCQSQGRAIELANGKTIPMKCHWSGVAEMALAFPFGGLGILLSVTRRRESHISLGVLGLVLGAFVVLLPTALIGVCADPAMICNAVMKPTLILAGSLLTAASVGTLVLAIRQKE